MAEHVPLSVKKSLQHGSVVIAAITSCTNTSNPSVMMAAGLLAKKAVEKGLTVPAWVKTSLAPGSKVVRDYLENAGLRPYLDELKFHIVGYGCTTCIGNSGPLPTEVSEAIEEKELVVASVLSGNRNFEGRINSEVRANYLDVAAAGGGLRAGGAHRYRPAQRRDRQRQRRQAGLSRRHLADAARSGRGGGEVSDRRDVYQELRGSFRRRRALARTLRPQGRDLRVGRRFHLHSPRSLFRRHEDSAFDRRRYHRRARAGGARRQRYHRPHFSRGLDQERWSGGKIFARAWREAGGLQLLRLAPRQSRSDGARNFRQRPPAQQAGRAWKAATRATCRRIRKCRSSTLRKNILPKGRR